jgi:uroporphyrinogen-III decarboxylase
MVNPRVFEKLQWPWYKKMVESYVSEGYTVILHLDGNWTPLLEYYTDLPPRSCVMELDITDMKKAKAVVGHMMCIKGNVNPVTLAMGNSEMVEAECKRLIDDCAPGGGFILSSGCEAPPNSRPENIREMIRCAREYGSY